MAYPSGAGSGSGACGDDLGLMPGCGVEADDLTAIEPAFGFVVGVGEADVPVGKEVGLGPTQIVNELVFCEPVTGFGGDLVFAVGRDIEPGRVELCEQCRGPATPIKDDRRPPVGTDPFADLGCDPFQFAAAFATSIVFEVGFSPADLGQPGFASGHLTSQILMTPIRTVTLVVGRISRLSVSHHVGNLVRETLLGFGHTLIRSGLPP